MIKLTDYKTGTPAYVDENKFHSVVWASDENGARSIIKLHGDNGCYGVRERPEIVMQTKRITTEVIPEWRMVYFRKSHPNTKLLIFVRSDSELLAMNAAALKLERSNCTPFDSTFEFCEIAQVKETT